MKKFLIIALVCVMTGGAALAGTLNVPWIRDDATSAAVQYNGFINVKNTTGSAIPITVQYWAADGTEITPSPNTFTIPAGAAIGFRPIEDLPGEGPGQAVPNADIGAFDKAISAAINWSGGASTDVQGRVLIRFIDVGSGAVTGTYGYLCPPGV